MAGLVEPTAVGTQVRLTGAGTGRVDAFPDEGGRQAHLDAALLARVESACTCFAVEPAIDRVDLFAAKLP